MAGPRNKGTPESFMARSVADISGCRLWTGRLNSSGYGVLRYHGKMWLAHRLSWSLNRGEIPSGMSVLHRCDVRNCVSADHLFIGNQNDNMKDCARKGRAARHTGVDNGRAKLNPSLAKSIRAERSSGAYLTTLATKYRVGVSTIFRVVTGQNWGEK